MWQRSKLRRGTAPWDLTTRVYWLQTPYWHADIRVPVDRPDFTGVDCLAACSESQLQALLQQEAFCGTTIVENDICRWVRQIDFRLRETNDFGRMVFEGNQLEEIGVETDYYELWHRLPGSNRRSFVLQQVRDDGGEDANKAFLCVAGDYFIYSRNRPMWTSPAVRARKQIELGKASRRDIEAFVDFESSFGKIEDGVGRIVMSTLPWREGQVAFDVQEFALERLAGSGLQCRDVQRRWKGIDESVVNANLAIQAWA
jgi:hypothetical protein